MASPNYSLVAIVITALVALFLWKAQPESYYSKVRNLVKPKCIKDCHQKPGIPFYGQSAEDKGLFNKIFSEPLICNGTFVEVGAYDGITYNNTKFFEDALGWSGVLIEAHPANVVKLRKNLPKAIIRDVAICPPGQKTVTFIGDRNGGGIKDYKTVKHGVKSAKSYQTTELPCMPMGVLLREAGINYIDLFSLDVEGAELMVLNTFDWAIPVRVFLIEMGHGRDTMIRALLKHQGYRHTEWNIRDFCPGRVCIKNEVFINTDLDHVRCQ